MRISTRSVWAAVIALLAVQTSQIAFVVHRQSLTFDPEEIISQTALVDIAADLGQKEQARQAWQAAIASAKNLEPDA